MQREEANGILPLICLSFGNPFCDYQAREFTIPHTNSGRTGFVNYARAFLNRWPQIKEVELWNEPGANFFRGPATADRPEYDSRLLKQLYPAVKAIRPDAGVVAGATFAIQTGFFRGLFQKDSFGSLDAVSIHPYGVIDALPLQVGKLRKLMSQFAPVKPVWVTEFSISTIPRGVVGLL